MERASDKVLAKVRALLAKAEDSAATGPEAEAYRAAAEGLMFKYRIEAAMLGDVDEKGHNLAPEWRTFDICEAGSEFRNDYHGFAATLLRHCDVRGVLFFGRNEQGRQMFSMNVVGYEAELRYFDVLFTSCVLAFAGKLEPRWDASLPLEENVYRMRSAGMERGRIARLAWPEQYGEGINKTLNKKVSEMFAREAEKRGDDPSVLLGRGNSVMTYRKSYAEAFSDEIWRRLARMRAARGAEQTAIVLMDRNKKVEEAYYLRYPHLRPRPADESAPYRAPNADCPKCKAAKSGYCREHGYLRPSNAAIKERPYSQAGAARGETAARSVDLHAPGHGVSRESNYRAVEG